MIVEEENMGVNVYINGQFDKYCESLLEFNEYYKDIDLIVIKSENCIEDKNIRNLYFHTFDFHETYDPPPEEYEYIMKERCFQREVDDRMINFKELASDGIAFEQLIREIFLREGYETHWTGVGNDQGRDLIVFEELEGPMSNYKRKWLVQCKHKAHSGNSVGINDIDSIMDSCSAINADGYLLACSTQPSSGLVRKFEEIERSKGLVIKYWDAIEIEKRLFQTNCFPLINLFFPETSKGIGWKIYNSNSPSFWAANYKDYFIYLSSRVAMTFPELKDAEAILDIIEQAPKLPNNQFLRPRAIYFDNKHEHFHVYLDYIVPDDAQIILTPSQLDAYFKDGIGLYKDETSMWYLTYWDIKLIQAKLYSDRYHRDSKSYYEPYIRDFEIGSFRKGSLSDLYYHNDKW